MTTQPTQLQVVYLPYLGMGDVDEIRDGNLILWNADKKLNEYVPDQALRDHVKALLEMNRISGREAGKPLPLRGIGVVSFGAEDFRPLTKARAARVKELQRRLFLAALSNNAGLKRSANAGHSLFTTENFTVVYQNFQLGSPWVGERTGFVVEMSIAGYTIDQTRWFRPSYVPHPSPFRIDEEMYRQTYWLRRKNRQLYRRILRATGVFMESYYNAQHVDVTARVLLQLMAFEILLDIPENQQRMHFKQAIGRLCRTKGDRKRSYKSERPGGKTATERGTLKEIWADRFYTLRNHLIHGNEVADREYMFRNAQHHLAASPVVFIAAVRALIDNERVSRGERRVFKAMLRWSKWEDVNDTPGTNYEGFTLELDWHAIVLEELVLGKKKRS